MSRAEVFVQSGGGFSRVVGSAVKQMGGRVLWPNSGMIK
jgi:hypothetical protein